MVSSTVPVLEKNSVGKLFKNDLLFPLNPSNAVVSDPLELDFSDVFGPVPVQASTTVIPDDTGICNTTATDVCKCLYDDPVVIRSRSHSLLGPSSCISESLKLNRVTLHDDCVEEEMMKEYNQYSISEDVTGCSFDNVKGDPIMLQTIGLEDFEVLSVVGQGAFGRVYQVRKKGSAEIYAMKVMRKDKIMEKDHVEYMKTERDILTKIDHPFIVQLQYSFQTKYRLYLVLDFINGGHLFFQLAHHGLFREDLARVYAAEIVSAVSHLHTNGIMHRDLKPENILLDADGHVILTDFGLAKHFGENTRSNSMCGTVEYMAPEIVLGKGHDKAADWWSVGILLYEMLTGKPPFVGNRQKIQQKIVKDKIKLPAFLTSEAHSLLKDLLNKDPSKRLGSGPCGAEEIKRHKWFKPINWKKLEAREIKPGFCPEVSGKHCIANFDKCWTNMPLSESPAATPKTNENPFGGFTFVRLAGAFLRRNSPMV